MFRNDSEQKKYFLSTFLKSKFYFIGLADLVDPADHRPAEN